ncbi:sugar phosphate isomerase/epimerase family protein [Namhaeicola litoreus]|uniref:Sugar phosphate isomerase/epimerase family protein n=1 Tax=Namhaeicola litoreus TaxID=1052145 RepID=A0ABW3Y411_9FLAO
MSKRRTFLKQTALAAGYLPLSRFSFPMFQYADDDQLEVHIFSKHLQFLDFKETGAVAAEMGFDGVDLTVRPKGHVLPENVGIDLPRAVEDIRASGIRCDLITTAIESVENQLDVSVLKAASDVGIKYYRTNWFKFDQARSMKANLLNYQEEIYRLGELNQKLGLVGCYQNHAGRNVGASFWEIEKILETVNPQTFGTQYDIRHAMVEGGFSWQNGLELLHKRIKVIVLKDFKWGKINNKWEPVNVPIGEGMVDFDTYFKLLKKYKIKVPVSLHLEYDLGGAEKGNSVINVDKKVVFDAMQRDLQIVQDLWKNA